MSVTGHCRLCGTPVVDERHGYCEGPLCGADLAGQRVGDPTIAVQVGFERARVDADPGDVVEALLRVRNQGRCAERFAAFVFDEDRVTVEVPDPGAPIAAGAEAVWRVRYRVPRDLDTAGRLAEAGGFALPGSLPGLYHAAVRVEAARDRRVGAAAVLDVRIRADLDRDSGDRSSARGPRRGRGWLASAAVVTVAVLAVALGAVVANGDDDGPAGAGPTASAPVVTSTPAGTEVEPDSTVQVVVSTGRPPAGKVVPNVVGQTVQKAESTLQADGLTMLRIDGQTLTSGSKDPVLIRTQKPIAGSTVPPGSTIEVTAS